jgi:hypothetical protein
MVIFTAHYREPGTLLTGRSRPSGNAASSFHNNSHPNGRTSVKHCQLAVQILCRLIVSVLLLIIALFIFEPSGSSEWNERSGPTIFGSIVFIVAIVSFLRTCQSLRRYCTLMNARRRWLRVQAKGIDDARCSMWVLSISSDYVHGSIITTSHFQASRSTLRCQ